MGRRLPYATTRKNLHLRKDLVEFFEGLLLANPAEQRVNYGFNDFLNELMAERQARVLAEGRAAAAEGFSPPPADA